MKRMQMRMTNRRKHHKTAAVGRRKYQGFNFFPKLLVIGVLLGISFFSLSFFKTMNPFYSFNPFNKDITIGEPVIGSWHYGGIDVSGNLRFYLDPNGSQTVLIPPGSKQFAADGTYVMLVNHTPVSLQFETRNQYLLQMAVQAGVFLAFLLVVLIFLVNLGRKPTRKSGFRSRYRKR